REARGNARPAVPYGLEGLRRCARQAGGDLPGRVLRIARRIPRAGDTAAAGGHHQRGVLAHGAGPGEHVPVLAGGRRLWLGAEPGFSPRNGGQLPVPPLIDRRWPRLRRGDRLLYLGAPVCSRVALLLSAVLALPRAGCRLHAPAKAILVVSGNYHRADVAAARAGELDCPAFMAGPACSSRRPALARLLARVQLWPGRTATGLSQAVVGCERLLLAGEPRAAQACSGLDLLWPDGRLV